MTTETGMVSLSAYGNTVLALANKEVDNISEYILLQSTVFTPSNTTVTMLLPKLNCKNNIENIILNYKQYLMFSFLLCCFIIIYYASDT
jgi:pyoverdine/dityrosine biosynthesis protein Dit1